MWRQLRYYVPFAWRFFVLQQQLPLIYGISLTDRCNLQCRGCTIANTGRPDMSWEQLQALMQSAWQRGFRELYFTGGEPMLWHAEGHSLADAVAAAKQIGFFHVHIYTNGTLGLDSAADLVWVSMDGLPGTYEKRRGDHFALVEDAVRRRAPAKTAVIYVIDTNTAAGVTPFLRWVVDTRLPIFGVMFYFHTPYYGYDELYLDAAARALIIDELQKGIKAGLPIINSPAGLWALKSGNWPRRTSVAAVADVDGESICCRAPAETCADCGYTACIEITETQRLRPSALWAMRRYW